MAKGGKKTAKGKPEDCAEAALDILCQCFFALGAGAASAVGSQDTAITRGAAHAFRNSLVVRPIGNETWPDLERRWAKDGEKILKLVERVGNEAAIKGGRKVGHAKLKAAFEEYQLLFCEDQYRKKAAVKGKYCKGFEDAQHD
jgi:hypothetical protein